MRTDEIRFTKTLDYYDGILVFEAKDPIGGTYVALHLENREQGDRYLLVGCRPDELRMFRHGATDLRSLITKSAIYGWYLADLAELDIPLVIVKQGSGSVPNDYLPGEGYKISDFEVDHGITETVIERDNVIIQVSIEPPESVGEHAVKVDTLSGLIDRVQELARHAVEQEYDAETRTEGDRDAGQLEVIGLSQGSVIVTFQGASGLGPDRESILARAFERLDDLFNHGDTLEDAKEVLTRYNSKTAMAYAKLMRFLRTKKTGFYYTWASPSTRIPSHRAVSLEKARRLARGLPIRVDENEDDNPLEDIVLEGILEMADESKSKWRLGVPGQGIRNGTVAEGGPTLRELVIHRRYRFVCVEERRAGTSRSRRRPTLYLKAITQL